MTTTELLVLVVKLMSKNLGCGGNSVSGDGSGDGGDGGGGDGRSARQANDLVRVGVC